MIEDIAAIAAGMRSPLSAPRSDAKGAEFAAILARAGAQAAEGAGQPHGLGRAPVLDLDPQRVQADTAAFGEELTQRLKALGVDTSVPINLEIAGDGSIRVRGDHPDKDKIEYLFASDHELANRYRALSVRNTLVAIARIAAEFHAAYGDAEDDEERKALWQDFRARIRQVSANSGNMTLSNGVLAPSGPVVG